MRTIFLKSGRFLLGVALAMPSLLLAAPPTQYEVQKLLASDGSEDSWFGFDVVMTGDTAAISATNAAYVFTRGATGQWSEQTKLVPSDRAAWNWCVTRTVCGPNMPSYVRAMVLPVTTSAGLSPSPAIRP